MTRLGLTAIASSVLLVSTPVFADGHGGDAEAGAATFSKSCKTCHMISNGDEVIVKGGKTGPNLYNVYGRTAGTAEGFKKYGKHLKAAGEAGLVWDTEQLVAYLPDPKKYLRSYLDDKKAKSKMAFKLKKGAEDVAAYLKTVSPDAPAGEGS